MFAFFSSVSGLGTPFFITSSNALPTFSSSSLALLILSSNSPFFFNAAAKSSFVFFMSSVFCLNPFSKSSIFFGILSSPLFLFASGTAPFNTTLPSTTSISLIILASTSPLSVCTFPYSLCFRNPPTDIS